VAVNGLVRQLVQTRLCHAAAKILRISPTAPKFHISQFVARAKQASEAKRRRIERAQRQARLAAASAAVATPVEEEEDSEAVEPEQEPQEEDWTGASPSVICLKEVFADATRAELECALAQARSQRFQLSGRTQTSNYTDQSLCAERKTHHFEVEADLLHDVYQAGGNVEEATEKLFVVLELRSMSVSEEERREQAEKEKR
jgi:hypothetical protein